MNPNIKVDLNNNILGKWSITIKMPTIIGLPRTQNVRTRTLMKANEIIPPEYRYLYASIKSHVSDDHYIHYVYHGLYTMTAGDIISEVEKKYNSFCKEFILFQLEKTDETD